MDQLPGLEEEGVKDDVEVSGRKSGGRVMSVPEVICQLDDNGSAECRFGTEWAKPRTGVISVVPIQAVAGTGGFKS